MIETKSPLQSLTVNSLLIGLAVQLLALFGVQIAPETAAQIGESINSIIAAVMILVAIYGRFRATKTIAVGDAARSPAIVAIAALALIFLASGCSQPTPPATAGSEPAAPSLAVVALPADRLLTLAEAASTGISAATEEAISSGALTGTAAIEARERVDQVNTALLIARGVASVFNAQTATERLLAVFTLAAAAQAALPVFRPAH